MLNASCDLFETGRSLGHKIRYDGIMHTRFKCLMGCVLLAVMLCACGGVGWPFNTRPQTSSAALGDLDGDGDLDLYLANRENEGVVADVVWLNDGAGRFDAPLVQPYEAETLFISLADLNRDGSLDAVLGLNGAVQLAFNTGGGRLADDRRFLLVEDSAMYSAFPDLGDLDRDGDLDLVVAGCCGGVMSGNGWQRLLQPFSLVWWNDGQGQFTDSGQRLGPSGASGAALGDLDGDGDLDLLMANSSQVSNVNGASLNNEPNQVWWNDGQGQFTDSGQRLGGQESYAAALGDLDGDGDLDAFFGNQGPDEIWWNDGSGSFTNSGLVLRQAPTRLAQLVDLDGDGDLDLFAADRGEGEVWLNHFRQSVGEPPAFTRSQQLTYSQWSGAALGDVDGDGDPDLVLGRLDEQVQVWWNDGAGSFSQR
jgi:hypothetical protein